jgi:hypothetical protein
MLMAGQERSLTQVAPHEQVIRKLMEAELVEDAGVSPRRTPSLASPPGGGN